MTALVVEALQHGLVLNMRSSLGHGKQHCQSFLEKQDWPRTFDEHV